MGRAERRPRRRPPCWHPPPCRYQSARSRPPVRVRISAPDEIGLPWPDRTLNHPKRLAARWCLNLLGLRYSLRVRTHSERLLDQAARDDVFLLQTTDDTLNGKTGAPRASDQHHVNLFLRLPRILTAATPAMPRAHDGSESLPNDANASNQFLPQRLLHPKAQFHDRVKEGSSGELKACRLHGEGTPGPVFPRYPEPGS